MILVDLGVMFFDMEILSGIDLIFFDMIWLIENKDCLEVIFIIYGYEDYIGVVGYFWDWLGVLVYVWMFMVNLVWCKMVDYG